MEGDYGYVEEQMLHDHTGIKPDQYKRYMDDVAGAFSCTEDDLTQSPTFASNYHPKLGYPVQLVREGRSKAASTPRALLLTGTNTNQTGTNRVPMVTTYHPKYTPVYKILSRNYNILANDDSTRVIFSQPPFKAYRRAKNLGIC